MEKSEMKKPKSVSDLTHNQIVDLWMREYQYFMVMEGEDHTTIPSEYELVFHSNKVWMGDHYWIEDYLYQLSDDGAYKLEGTWGDVFRRVEAEPRLKAKINKAEAARLKKIAEWDAEWDAEVERRAELRRKQQEHESLLIMPWISAKKEMPNLDKDSVSVFTKYLITDGKEVKVAQLSEGQDGKYFYVPGENSGSLNAFSGDVKYWMPLDRLLIYLPALELSA